MRLSWSVCQSSWHALVGSYARADIRPIGQDIRGQRVLEAGMRLGPQEIGLLASLGYTSLVAYPRPRVAVLSTGDEIVEPGNQPRPGQIRDSNRYALMAAVQRAGAQPVSLGIGSDRQDELTDKIEAGLATCDAVITSGGVSMGELDLIKPFSKAGRGALWAGQSQTGRAADVCHRGPQTGVCPAGFPVSSLVSFEIFVRPALRQMSGQRLVLRPHVPVTLAEPIQGDAWRPSSSCQIDPGERYVHGAHHGHAVVGTSALYGGSEWAAGAPEAGQAV
jgi:molybdenum cofactor synthesis domain-containing protein